MHQQTSQAWKDFRNGTIIVTVILAVLFAAVGAIVVGVHASRINGAKENAATIPVQNHFWEMVTTGNVDSNQNGQFAKVIHDKLQAENPAKALSGVYVYEGQYGKLEKRLGMNVYTDKSSGSQTSAEGPLDPEFIVKALQANPTNLKDLVVTPKPAPETGLRSWSNYIGVISGILASGGLVLGGGYASRSVKRSHVKSRQRRAEKEAFNNLSFDAQQLTVARKQVEALPQNDPKIRDLLKQIDTAIKAIKQEENAEQSDAQVRRIRETIDETLAQREAVKKAYRELR